MHVLAGAARCLAFLAIFFYGPLGPQTVRADTLSCYPLEDLTSDPSSPAVAAYYHGNACLDAMQYVAALTKFRQSLRLQPTRGASLCALVGLGIAYYELTRNVDAASAWRRANLNKAVRPTIGLEFPLLRGDRHTAMVVLQQHFASKTILGGGFTSVVGNQESPLNPIFDAALRQAATGHEERAARAISGLLFDRPGNGGLYYAYAIVLLALGQTNDAKEDLEYAARKNVAIMPGDDCDGVWDYQFSAIYLLEHLNEIRR